MNPEPNKKFIDISEKKRDKILQTAVAEFAQYGYDSANINTIAEKAGISVGSIYKYFHSKQDLYLTAAGFTVEKLKSVLNEIISSKTDFLSTVERIIRAIQLYSRDNIYLTKLYNEMTTENKSELVWRIVSDMEGITANLYASYIREAQENEGARKDVDPRCFAFFIDNLFIVLQFSYCCEYYKERLKMFIDDNIMANDDLLAGQLVKFIRGALYLK